MKNKRDARYYRHMEKLKKREAERKAQSESPRINLNTFGLALFFMAEKTLLLLADPPVKEDMGRDIFTYLVLAGCAVYCLVKYFRTKKAEAAKTDWIVTADYAERKAKDYRSNLWFWIFFAVFFLAIIVADILTDHTQNVIGETSVLFAAALLLAYINFKNYRKAKQELNEIKEEDA